MGIVQLFIWIKTVDLIGNGSRLVLTDPYAPDQIWRDPNDRIKYRSIPHGSAWIGRWIVHDRYGS